MYRGPVFLSEEKGPMGGRRVGSRDWEERREGVETVIVLENKLAKESQTEQKVHRGLLRRNS